MVIKDTHVPENSVPVPDSVANEALAWAKLHTPSYITNVGEWDSDLDEAVYYFFFSEERDVTAFTLRWL